MLTGNNQEFSGLKFLYKPNPKNITDGHIKYQTGIGFFNYILSENDYGYQPILLESNPLVCDQIYEENLTFYLNI